MRILYLITTLFVALSMLAVNNAAIGQQIDDNPDALSEDLNPTGVTNVDTDSWLLTWGGGHSCVSNEVFIDDAGNIFVVGKYDGEVDLDPGPGTEIHVSTAEISYYVTKFERSGNFLWARTWDEPGIHLSQIAADQFGNMYLTGSYEGTVDFDPGEDVNEHTSNGYTDDFLLKLNPFGDFEWAGTWGSIGYEFSPGLDVYHDGSIYVAGTFRETVDFDPGPGINEIYAGTWDRSVFLSRFNTDGELVWTRAFAPSDFLGPFCDEVKVDSQGDVYLTGTFEGTIGFTSGETLVELTSNGRDDVFLCKFASSGDFEWAHSWGGVKYEFSGDIAFDSVGNVYTTGSVSNQCTYNISDDTDGMHYGSSGVTTNETSDIYLIAFDSSGVLQWLREWGGPGFDTHGKLVIDALDIIYLGAHNQITVDSPYEDPYFGENQTYMATFDTSGVYLGNTNIAEITGSGNSRLIFDSSGYMYLTGSFEGSVEFEMPGQVETRNASVTDAFLARIPAPAPIRNK